MANPWRFASGYLDSETGLYKFVARYYDPGVQLWTQPDPNRGSIQDPMSLNLYLYVTDSPVNATDPSGTFCFSCILVGVTVAVGVGIGVAFLGPHIRRGRIFSFYIPQLALLSATGASVIGGIVGGAIGYGVAQAGLEYDNG